MPGVEVSRWWPDKRASSVCVIINIRSEAHAGAGADADADADADATTQDRTGQDSTGRQTGARVTRAGAPMASPSSSSRPLVSQRRTNRLRYPASGHWEESIPVRGKLPR